MSSSPALRWPLPVPEPEFRIVRARREDFETVAHLFEAVRSYNASLDSHLALADEWRAVLSRQFCNTYAKGEKALWLLAWRGHTAVGLLVVVAHLDSPLLKHRRWAEVMALYVAPAWRGSGLAQQLMTKAHAWAAAYGFDRVQVHAAASNEPARRFYRRSGFQPVQEVLRLQVRPSP